MKKRKSIYKRGFVDLLRSAVAPILFTLAVVGMIAFGLGQTKASSKSEGLKVLQDSIVRATVKCYAIEGRYPDTIDYIEKNYGIRIDREKYAVHYEIVASNLFPEITVIDMRSD